MTMLYVAERSPMAKGKGRSNQDKPSKPPGEGTQVRVDSDVVRKARVVSSEKGVTLNAYLTAILKAKVDEDYRQVIAAAAAALELDDESDDEGEDE